MDRRDAHDRRDTSPVSSSRLEAFSDGVIAILITILVLELRPPEGADLSDLRPLIPKLLTSQLVERVDGRVLWANMHLLFWLSLTSFATAWMGEHPRETAPVETYGVVLLGAAIAYYLLTRALLARHGSESRLAVALGSDTKGKLSALAYVAGVLIAWEVPELAIAIYVSVALVWLVPDRRITRVIEQG